jgi:trigger factor
MTTETEALKVDIEERAAWARRLSITVPGERVERQRRDVMSRLAKRLKLPGFRQGKIPGHILEKRYGSAIEQEAVERVVGEAYKEAIQQQQLQPITQGAVQAVEYRPGSDLVFDVELEVRPELRLERVTGFRVQRPVVVVEDEEVERVLGRLREEHAVWRPLEGTTPLAGDAVEVEITPLSGEGAGEARRYEFVLGEGQAVPDVEDAIRTLAAEQEGEFEIALEGDESPERQAVRIRLLGARRPELPEVDDEFARGLGEFEDAAALRARIREDLLRESESESEREVRRQLLGQILEANPFEVPASMVDQYLERALPARKGMDEARLAELRSSARDAAADGLRRMLVVEQLAEQEGLRATTEEVDARVEQLAERIGRPVGEVWAQLQKSGRLQAMEEELTEEKVFDWLKSRSTVEGGGAAAR